MNTIPSTIPLAMEQACLIRSRDHTIRQLRKRQQAHARNLSLFGPYDELSVATGFAVSRCKHELATVCKRLADLESHPA